MASMKEVHEEDGRFRIADHVAPEILRSPLSLKERASSRGIVIIELTILKGGALSTMCSLL